MTPKYTSAKQIPDEVIIQAFRDADEISFAVKPFNTIQGRHVHFGNLDWWLPLTRVLPLIDVTPQMLRPVFVAWPQKIWIKRHFPANLNWLGLNRRTTKEVTRVIPDLVETYEELGSFPTDDIPFKLWSTVIFKKPIKVYRCDGGMDNPLHIFTVYLSGQVIGGADATV